MSLKELLGYLEQIPPLKRKASPSPTNSPKKPRYEEPVDKDLNHALDRNWPPQDGLSRTQHFRDEKARNNEWRNGQRRDDRPRSPKREKSHVNSYNGQRYAIPGLDDDDGGGDEQEDGELDEEAQTTKDALNYLRSVRKEADRIPNLLVASATKSSDTIKHTERRDEEVRDNDLDDHDEDYELGTEPEAVEDLLGFYADGVYAAYHPVAPRLSPSYDSADDSGEPRLIYAQSYYQAALLRRYDSVRQSLSVIPPESVLVTLDPQVHPIYFSQSRSNRKEQQHWVGVVLNAAPKKAQLAAMDKWDALWLLELVGETLLSQEMMNQSGALGKRISTWVWGLLGRVAECETMSSEEVAIMRQVGKLAVRLVKVLLNGGNYDPELGQGNTADTQTAQDGHEPEEAGEDASLEEERAPIERFSWGLETGTRQNRNSSVPQKQQNGGGRRRNSSSSIESNPEEDFYNADNANHFDFGNEPSSTDNPYNSTNSIRPAAGFDPVTQTAIPDVDNSPTPPTSKNHNIEDVLDLIAAMRSELAVDTTTKSQQDDCLSATLNLILTVVGERYGQRDLLWARDELWSMHEDGRTQNPAGL